MSSVGGTTTVTEAASAASVDSKDAALLWLFPRASAPVALHGERKRELTIGRDETSSVCLTGNDVSRRHAVLHSIRSPECVSPTSAAATVSA